MEPERTAGQIWLEYFNRTLLRRGVIRQGEYERMRGMIGERYASHRDKDREEP